MSGTLNVYTDASVKGRLLPPGADTKRSRYGPAFTAWAGWHGCAPPRPPTFAGQSYVGEWHGTQTAEFEGLIGGLGAVLSYVQTAAQPDEVCIHVDNRCVFLLMIGMWRADVLAPWVDVANGLERQLRDLGLEVNYRYVSEAHPVHRVVHCMTKQAPQQVLVKPEWRPSDELRTLAA